MAQNGASSVLGVAAVVLVASVLLSAFGGGILWPVSPAVAAARRRSSLLYRQRMPRCSVLTYGGPSARDARGGQGRARHSQYRVPGRNSGDGLECLARYIIFYTREHFVQAALVVVAAVVLWRLRGWWFEYGELRRCSALLCSAVLRSALRTHERLLSSPALP